MLEPGGLGGLEAGLAGLNTASIKFLLAALQVPELPGDLILAAGDDVLEEVRQLLLLHPVGFGQLDGRDLLKISCSLRSVVS